MASAVIPIRQIKIDSTLSTTLSRTSLIPTFFRKPLLLWIFPKVLRFVNGALSSERVGRLTTEQAKELYGPLNQMYIEVNAILSKISADSLFTRKVLSGWTASVQIETERLGEIVETLAWGADDELRSFIESAIEDVTSRA